MTSLTNRPPARPSLVDYLSEPYRASVEYVGFATSKPLLALGRVGDGRHVLVVPGLMADDRSTTALRRLLRTGGYQSHGWRLGRNIGPTRDIVNGLIRRAEELTDRSGAPISLVGWSLGGILSRELATLRPELIDRVITLGSPLSISDPVQSRASNVYDAFAGRHLPDYSFDRWTARREMPDVPFTSVYTRADGIVHWEACLVPEGPRSENVQVYGSHCGLGANTSAAYVVLDRLETPAADWQPFRPPARWAALFPRSVSVAAAA